MKIETIEEREGMKLNIVHHIWILYSLGHDQ